MLGQIKSDHKIKPYFLSTSLTSLSLQYRPTRLHSRPLCTRFQTKIIGSWIGVLKYSKDKGHLEILGARRVTWIKFHTEDQQILGVTPYNLAATASWRPGFM
jgi:hypothetical protein